MATHISGLQNQNASGTGPVASRPSMHSSQAGNITTGVSSGVGRPPNSSLNRALAPNSASSQQNTRFQLQNRLSTHRPGTVVNNNQGKKKKL